MKQKGNITRLQRHTLDNRLIDDLQFTYSGNQVTAITDYAGSLDRYDTKEYTDRSTSANTVEQHYDANGNLTSDLDRGIQRIRYNILNLPDTVFFSNGNRLINSYDATGRKWQSQTVTLRESEVLPADDGTVFDADISSISLTQYDGTMEYQYRSSRSRPDSLVRTGFVVHNAEGYKEYAYITSAAGYTTQKPPKFHLVKITMYYYHRDHLGNNCAVWDATNNSIAQRTWYYASGTPMSISTAQGVQPYKYNGKEYVEVHGYDTYDYGFRGYYATIGRFTSIDPLTERTPWQSPYTYANNNWINQIDYMGLFGTSFKQGSCNWVAVNEGGRIVGWGTDNGDNRVYQVDEDWDHTYDGLEGYDILGWEIEELRWTYKEEDICYYRGRYQITYVQNGVVTIVASTRLMYGNTPVSNAQIDNSFQAALHYFWGNGYTAYLGGPFTEKEVLQITEQRISGFPFSYP